MNLQQSGGFFIAKQQGFGADHFGIRSRRSHAPAEAAEGGIRNPSHGRQQKGAVKRKIGYGWHEKLSFVL